MLDRNRLTVAVIAFGLFLLAIGAVLSDLGNRSFVNMTREQDVENANLQNVWGPLIARFGMLFFVGGLFYGAIFLETADPIVRLFMLILGFVALLLVLANSVTVFG